MPFNQWLQSRLTAHGFPCGAIDGIIGPLTRAAIRAFSVSRGLPPTDQAIDAVVVLLRQSSSRTTEPRPADLSEREVQAVDRVRPIWPRQKDVTSFYGAVGTAQAKVEVPFDMVLAWDKGHRISGLTVHTKVAASAQRALEAIAEAYSAEERASLGLNLFGGSLNVRRMRGGSAYSMHSWGIAIDFDPERNQLRWDGQRARLAEPEALPFWRIWEGEGWLSLGRVRDFDWMHVQAARL